MIKRTYIAVFVPLACILFVSCSDGLPRVAEHLKATPEWKSFTEVVDSSPLCQVLAITTKKELEFYQKQIHHFKKLNSGVRPEIIWITPSEYGIQNSIVSRALTESLIKNNLSNTFHFESGNLKLLSANSMDNSAKFLGDMHHFYKVDPPLADYILSKRPENYINLIETYAELGLNAEEYKGILFVLDPRRGCFETTFMNHISESNNLNTSGYVLLLEGTGNDKNLKAIKANFGFRCEVMAIPKNTLQGLEKLNYQIYNFPVNFILYNLNTTEFKESRYLSCDNAMESIYE